MENTPQKGTCETHEGKLQSITTNKRGANWDQGIGFGADSLSLTLLQRKKEGPINQEVFV
jgi:hypothetical protein